MLATEYGSSGSQFMCWTGPADCCSKFRNIVTNGEVLSVPISITIYSTINLFFQSSEKCKKESWIIAQKPII